MTRQDVSAIRPTASVVIPARNDAAGLARLLPELTGLDVTVVANGCTDDTADVATAAGVRVLILPTPGKAAALNAGDAVAVGFPRIYLDADVRVTAADFAVLIAVLDPGSRRGAAAQDGAGILAATLRRQLDVSGRSPILRGYFAIQSRLDIYRRALFGRGVIAVSEEGRSRFTTFGDLIADDLFLDRLFTDEEKTVADGLSLVDTPRTVGDLVSRLARVRAGTAQQGPTAGSRTSWLRVAVVRPWLWPATCCYVGITLAAELRRRRAPIGWEVAR